VIGVAQYLTSLVVLEFYSSLGQGFHNCVGSNPAWFHFRTHAMNTLLIPDVNGGASSDFFVVVLLVIKGTLLMFLSSARMLVLTIEQNIGKNLHDLPTGQCI